MRDTDAALSKEAQVEKVVEADHDQVDAARFNTEGTVATYAPQAAEPAAEQAKAVERPAAIPQRNSRKAGRKDADQELTIVDLLAAVPEETPSEMTSSGAPSSGATPSEATPSGATSSGETPSGATTSGVTPSGTRSTRAMPFGARPTGVTAGGTGSTGVTPPAVVPTGTTAGGTTAGGAADEETSGPDGWLRAYPM